ncbi:MAG TPA: YCF48-related protein [Blastocatellia bacterium]|nr:YCF48-related protein [Blastocatellia bacterium]
MPKLISRYAPGCLLIVSLCLAILQAQESKQTIQIASTPSKGEALALVGQLKSKGVEAYWIKAEVPGKGVRYRVRIGRFNSSAEARAQAERVRERGVIKDFIITGYESPSGSTVSTGASSKETKSRTEIFIKRKQVDQPEPSKTEKAQPAKDGVSSNSPAHSDANETAGAPGPEITAAERETAVQLPSPAVKTPVGPAAPSAPPGSATEKGAAASAKSKPAAAAGKAAGLEWKIADPFTADAIIDFSKDNNNWRVVRRSSQTDKNLRAIYFVDAMTGWAAGDSGLVLRTTDGGRTWKSLPNNFRANIRMLQFIDWNRGWMLGDVEGPPNENQEPESRTMLFSTQNGGRTWTSRPLPQVLSLYFLDAENGWAVGRAATVLKTTDGGEHWSQIVGIEKLVGLPIESSNYNFGFREIFFLDAKHGWMVGNFYGRARSNIGGLFVTTDGGLSWKRIPVTFQTQYSSGRFTPGRLQSVRFSDLNTGFMTGEMQDGEGRYFFALHTRDGGQTWNQFRTSSRADHNTQFLGPADGWTAAVASRDGETDPAMYDTTLLRTDNGGMSWRKDFIARGRRIHDLFFLNPRRGWAVGDRGLILCYEERPSMANK